MLALAGTTRAADLPAKVLTSNLPPFSIPNTPQRPGVSVEIVQEAFRRLGWPLHLTFVPWTQAQGLAATEPDTLAFSVTRTPEREASYRWIAPLVDIETAFIRLPPADPIDSFQAGRKLRAVGVATATPMESGLIQEGLTNLIAVRDEKQNALMLLHQRIDAWYSATLRANHVLRDAGYYGPLVIGKPLIIGTGWLVGNFGTSTVIVDQLARVIDQIRKDGTYTVVVSKYVTAPRQPAP